MHPTGNTGGTTSKPIKTPTAHPTLYVRGVECGLCAEKCGLLWTWCWRSGILWTSEAFMAKTVDSRQNALNRPRALRAEKPATQMGQIRWVWPEISAALSMGHSLTTIHQHLHEVGIEIPTRGSRSISVGYAEKTSLDIRSPQNKRQQRESGGCERSRFAKICCTRHNCWK